MTSLFMDLESIPGQAPWIREDIAKTVKHPGNIKLPESIAKWEKDKKPAAIDAAWAKTGLNGTYGEVICLSWAIDDNPVKTVKRDLGASEGDMLTDFFTQLKEDLLGDSNLSVHSGVPTWIGHNITGFDLRFLFQRCIVNNVRPTSVIPVNAKPWDNAVFDTFIEWSGFKSSGGGSLTAVCKALGIEDNDTIDGSQVWDCIQKGDLDIVVKHCEQDVEKVRQVHKRLTFQ